MESPPPSDDGVTTATVLGSTEPSESESGTESELVESSESGSEESSESGSEDKTSGNKVASLSLAPMKELMATVNQHLKDCRYCKGSKLILKEDRRIGLASNYVLACETCNREDRALQQKIYHLCRRRENCLDYKKRRQVSKELNRNKRSLIRRREQRAIRYVSSPISKKNKSRNNQRKLMDYSVNVRAIISSFYIGTGGLDIGLNASCLGLKGGKSWERTFNRHSKRVCKAVLKVVKGVISENMKMEIDLTIKEKLKEKYSASEIESLTQKYHAGVKSGIDEVDNILISVSFDMGWQKKVRVILTIRTVGMHISLVVGAGE